MAKEEPSKQSSVQERIDQKKAEAAGRRAVVILFLLTVGLSILFWFKKSLPEVFGKLFSPYQRVVEK